MAVKLLPTNQSSNRKKYWMISLIFQSSLCGRLGINRKINIPVGWVITHHIKKSAYDHTLRRKAKHLQYFSPYGIFISMCNISFVVGDCPPYSFLHHFRNNRSGFILLSISILLTMSSLSHSAINGAKTNPLPPTPLQI